MKEDRGVDYKEMYLCIMIIARRKRMFSPPNDTFGGK